MSYWVDMERFVYSISFIIISPILWFPWLLVTRSGSSSYFLAFLPRWPWWSIFMMNAFSGARCRDNGPYSQKHVFSTATHFCVHNWLRSCGGPGGHPQWIFGVAGFFFAFFCGVLLGRHGLVQSSHQNADRNFSPPNWTANFSPSKVVLEDCTRL
jgi:hypothetical protein